MALTDQPDTKLKMPTLTASGYLSKMSKHFWRTNGLVQDYLNFLLCEIDPLFSQKRLAAEVVRIQRETSETTTLVLSPAKRWRNFEAGQFTAIELEIDGIRYQRNYSLSCSPEYFKQTGLINLTIKQVPHGKVSHYINTDLKAGDVIHMSSARGKFIWQADDRSSKSALFVAGGSGITPIKSMIDHLTNIESSMPRAQKVESMTLVHYAKTAEDIIFRRHFEELAKRFPKFSYSFHFSDFEGSICREQLHLDCPNAKEREWFVCGPEGFMDAALQIARSLSVNEEQIHVENFGARQIFSKDLELGQPGQVSFRFANRTVQSNGRQSLLELAELAGLRPKYGCRNGICHECKCDRPRGSLINRLSGEHIAHDQGTVQACIAVPAGDLTLYQW